MVPSTSFQCPETGQMVIARYAFGKVTLEAADEEWVKEGIISAETDAQTKAYCQRHTGHRCHSVDEADEYIVKVSDGQTFGFDRS